MSDVVIRAENLGKRYCIGERARYLALRDVLTRAVYAPARLFRPRKPSSSNGDYSHIWALEDVSFDIRQGEVVGIIGRNGAGKSTLLKIVARVTKPTRGFAEVRGRMGTLLEVGTGFHPELTGRDNVFLSGAILGMSKAEIRRKFDEIVAFSDVEKFIDTPLKHYSTGMQMRLAFAVAAHLEPEILLVDEVLAVGDLEFQKKCLGKMGDVAKDGRTILFVSHNMGAINDLCERCLLLNGGRVQADGASEKVTRTYLLQSSQSAAMSELEPRQSGATFLAVEIEDDTGESTRVLDVRRPIDVWMRFRLKQRIPNLEVSLAVFSFQGDRIFYHSNAYADAPTLAQTPGVYTAQARIPAMLLAPGSYLINLGLHIPNEIFDFREGILSFDIEDTGTGRHDYVKGTQGYVLAPVEWTVVADGA